MCVFIVRVYLDATHASTLGCGVDRCMVPPSHFFVCRVSGEVNSEAKSKALERCVCCVTA